MSDNLVQRLRKFVPPRGLRVDESEFAMADAADEIDRLSAANAELLEALEDLLSQYLDAPGDAQFHDAPLDTSKATKAIERAKAEGAD